MGKLFIKDMTTRKTYTFFDSSSGYAAAQNKLDQLNQAGHRVDLSTNSTGKRLQEMQDAKGGLLKQLFG
ncbi:hypothetical protein IJI72_00935 [Candidatus Saccharibacteria bacterium]|nr:hypothetical protein [Candidatus Saccharibacteria bacterium]